jgi:hypothetical protein
VESARSPVDESSRPSSLDELLDGFDRLGADLVRLAEYDLPEVERALTSFDRSVRAHLTGAGATSGARDADRRGSRTLLLESEHERFLTSLDQLWWLFAIVKGNDHGGHRQALGQYMRILVEALRRHRDDERGVESPPDASRERGARASASGNAN